MLLISEEQNRVVLNGDPTAHAEILAIRKAALLLKSHDLKDCILYCSCEPCPMCLGAIYWAGIKKVVFACDRNDAANAGFGDKDIYDEIIREPTERRIKFLKLENTGGDKIFRKWEMYDSKTPY